MDRIIRKINRQKILFILLTLCITAVNFGVIFGNSGSDAAFADMIRSFAENGLIPGTNGNYISLGDYEDSFANMGYSAMTPLWEAEHFVISAKLDWNSANMTPNSVTNGCGFYFHAVDNTKDHLMVSLRGDGNMYLSGQRNYTILSYGKHPFALPSRAGSADLCLIVDGSDLTIYLNGEQFLRQSDLPVSGNVLGVSVLSGTFQDYGTKCTVGNINIFTWE